MLHQPRYEIFKQFDDVIILAPGGRTAYFGPRDKVIEYFESLGFVFEPLQNPADVLMDIVSGKGTTNAANVSLDTDALVQKWTDHITASEQSGLESITPLMAPSESEWQHAQIAQVIRKRGASFWRQVYYCHQRSLIQQYRLFSSFALEIFVGLLAGGLMGLSTVLKISILIYFVDGYQWRTLPRRLQCAVHAHFPFARANFASTDWIPYWHDGGVGRRTRGRQNIWRGKNRVLA